MGSSSFICLLKEGIGYAKQIRSGFYFFSTHKLPLASFPSKYITTIVFFPDFHQVLSQLNDFYSPLRAIESSGYYFFCFCDPSASCNSSGLSWIVPMIVNSYDSE